jgi:hypothetical protein
MVTEISIWTNGVALEKVNLQKNSLLTSYIFYRAVGNKLNQ